MLSGALYKQTIVLALLSTSGLSGQFIGALPGEAVPLAACMYWAGTGQPIVGAIVYFDSAVDAGSGGHVAAGHDSFGPRPKGSFMYTAGSSHTYAYTDINGCARVTWDAPIFAGSHGVLATSNYGNGYTTIHVWINAGGDWLQEMMPSADYALVGSTGVHPGNHYGTASTVALLQDIMRRFRQDTSITGHVNDMSLVWGGKFDFYRPNSSLGCWSDQHSCPHSEHRMGRNADIPFSGLGTRRETFLALATIHGGSSGGPILDEGNHYHLRFQY